MSKHNSHNKGYSKLAMTFYIILAAIAVFLVMAAMQPNEIKISRSMTMKASAAEIFPHINEMNKWEAWSPWAKLDPEMKKAFIGPNSGIGAGMSWDGNSKVGKGSMTVSEIRPNELVKFDMKFEKPMESTSTSEFTFKQEGGETVVTWSMECKHNFVGKVMCLAFNCKKMIETKYDEGLTNIKNIVEKK